MPLPDFRPPEDSRIADKGTDTPPIYIPELENVTNAISAGLNAWRTPIKMNYSAFNQTFVNSVEPSKLGKLYEDSLTKAVGPTTLSLKQIINEGTDNKVDDKGVVHRATEEQKAAAAAVPTLESALYSETGLAATSSQAIHDFHASWAKKTKLLFHPLATTGKSMDEKFHLLHTTEQEQKADLEQLHAAEKQRFEEWINKEENQKLLQTVYGKAINLEQIKENLLKDIDNRLADELKKLSQCYEAAKQDQLAAETLGNANSKAAYINSYNGISTITLHDADGKPIQVDTSKGYLLNRFSEKVTIKGNTYYCDLKGSASHKRDQVRDQLLMVKQAQEARAYQKGEDPSKYTITLHAKVFNPSAPYFGSDEERFTSELPWTREMLRLQWREAMKIGFKPEQVKGYIPDEKDDKWLNNWKKEAGHRLITNNTVRDIIAATPEIPALTRPQIEAINRSDFTQVKNMDDLKIELNKVDPEALGEHWANGLNYNAKHYKWQKHDLAGQLRRESILNPAIREALKSAYTDEDTPFYPTKEQILALNRLDLSDVSSQKDLEDILRKVPHNFNFDKLKFPNNNALFGKDDKITFFDKLPGSNEKEKLANVRKGQTYANQNAFIHTDDSEILERINNLNDTVFNESNPESAPNKLAAELEKLNSAKGDMLVPGDIPASIDAAIAKMNTIALPAETMIDNLNTQLSNLEALRQKVLHPLPGHDTASYSDHIKTALDKELATQLAKIEKNLTQLEAINNNLTDAADRILKNPAIKTSEIHKFKNPINDFGNKITDGLNTTKKKLAQFKEKAFGIRPAAEDPSVTISFGKGARAA